MMKLVDFLKSNKKVIIVAIVIAVLIAAVFIINSNENKTAASSVTAQSQTEIKLTEILSSIKGVGEAEVMINESEGEIMGVVIVCSGADSIMTRNDILNAVSTALCINKNLIAIYSMSN